MGPNGWPNAGTFPGGIFWGISMKSDISGCCDLNKNAPIPPPWAHMFECVVSSLEVLLAGVGVGVGVGGWGRGGVGGVGVRVGGGALDVAYLEEEVHP